MNLNRKSLVRIIPLVFLGMVLFAGDAHAGIIRGSSWYDTAGNSTTSYIHLKGGMSGTVNEMIFIVDEEHASGGRYWLVVYDCGVTSSSSFSYGDCTANAGAEYTYWPNVGKSSFSRRYVSMVAGGSTPRMIRFDFDDVCKMTNGGACAYQDYMTLQSDHYYVVALAGTDNTYVTGRDYDLVGASVYQNLGTPYGNLTVTCSGSAGLSVWGEGGASSCGDLLSPVYWVADTYLTTDELALFGWSAVGVPWISSASYLTELGASNSWTGTFIDVARDFVGFTFVPSAKGFNVLNVGLQSLFDVSPFNWLDTVLDTWEQASIATSSVPTIAFDYQYSPDTASVSLEIFSGDTVDMYLGSTWDVLYDLMEAGIWLSLGLYLYRRLVNLV